MRHQEDKQSKATSSLFPMKMIAKLELTQSNAQQHIEQLQNPSKGVTNNNRMSALERTAAKATGGGGEVGGRWGGGLNAYNWYQIFDLDSAVEP